MTHATRVGRDRSATAPAAISRTASGSSSCSIGVQRAPGPRRPRAASGSSTARCRIIGPVSTPLVDEVDRDSEHLDAVVERLLDGVQARETPAAAPGGR